MTINATPLIIVYLDTRPYRSAEERDTFRLHIEIHELCHINQAWQWIQDMHTDMDNDWFKNNGWPANHYSYGFYKSKAGKKFIDMVGFTQKNNSRLWNLPANTIYRDIYSKSPFELSAELCTLYLLDKMGEKKIDITILGFMVQLLTKSHLAP